MRSATPLQEIVGDSVRRHKRKVAYANRWDAMRIPFDLQHRDSED